jgi:ornithine decarboxylase
VRELPSLNLSQVTHALEEFLARTDVPTPYVVVDLDVVEERYCELRNALPDVSIFYAVKANPGQPLLDRLAQLGSSFDVASPAEIDRCLHAGVHPDQISYGNTIKKRRDVAYAYLHGVRRFTVDSVQELQKVIDEAPHSEVCIRLLHNCGGADWPLSRKFGCEAPDVVRLLVMAAEAGMRPGISFHVGSQQRDLSAWDSALERVASISTEAIALGARVEFVNLGGGFPGTYEQAAPSIGEYGNTIRGALEKHFPEGAPELMVEPGRYMVADAGVLRSEVVLVSRRSPSDEQRWVYIDCGKFHGLAETMDEAIRYRMRTPHDGTAVGPVVLAGPTCDSADVLYEKYGYDLPLSLSEGDMVDILSAGAYTTTYSSIGFNGFPPLAEYFVSSEGTSSEVERFRVSMTA